MNLGWLITKPSTEEIMTEYNTGRKGVRLCAGKVISDEKVVGGKKIFSFKKRSYSNNATIDPEKYEVYFQKEIKPVIQRSNALIEKEIMRKEKDLRRLSEITR
jgi:hypothetical protein